MFDRAIICSDIKFYALIHHSFDINRWKMGGVLSDLCVLLARNKCRPSVVASALTFFPPDPPFYSFVACESDEDLVQGRAGGVTSSDDGDPASKTCDHSNLNSLASKPPIRRIEYGGWSLDLLQGRLHLILDEKLRA